MSQTEAGARDRTPTKAVDATAKPFFDAPIVTPAAWDSRNPSVPRRQIRDSGPNWTFYGPVGRWVHG